MVKECGLLYHISLNLRCYNFKMRQLFISKHFSFLTFYFEIVLGLQKCCK